MKAWVLHDIADIRYDDTELETPAKGWVTVRVKAAGICGSDIPRIYKTGAHKMPLIPGHEFSGIVDSVGPNVDKDWIGRSVGVFPLIPCRQCDPCSKGLYEMCRNYDYIGSRRDGAFAEYVNVPVVNLIALPEGVAFDEAAMLEPMAVAVKAVRKATDGFRIDKDAKIVVCGLGTIGLLVVMFLVEAGYTNVSAIGNKEGQRKRVEGVCSGVGNVRLSYVDYREPDAIQRKCFGADVFVECVGKNEIVALGINCVGPAGRVVLVGNPYSDMQLDKDTYWKILRNQLTVVGVWNSRFDHTPDDDWNYVLKRLEKHTINSSNLITHRYELPELEKGLFVMRDKTEDYCKVICEERLSEHTGHGSDKQRNFG